jgi:polyphosphate kinase 1
MSKISAIKSLIMFNQRVLSLGEVIDGKTYTMNELKKTLSFNQIFINNMNEIFKNQKKFTECIDEYNADLKKVHLNLYNIINKIMEIDKSIMIELDDRYQFECRFAILDFIKNGLMIDVINKTELETYHFDEGLIYYIISAGSSYIIYHMDSKCKLYQCLISYKFNDYIRYWKTDAAMLSYLKNNHKDDSNDIYGIVMKVTKSSDSHDLVKVDMYGETDDMQSIYNDMVTHSNWHDKFIIKNQFMYMSDIEQIITSSKLYQNIPAHTNVFASDNDKESFLLSDIFDKDILVEYPNDSFDSYLRLLHLASIDNRVESISVTLYRIGNNPIIYYILRDAVRRGVQVHVNLELRASEEKINKFWASEMKAVGIDVAHYADGYLKVHCKLTLIKFKDNKMIAQIGTGNYHSQTTSQYTDFSLMTTDKKMTSQISDLFDVIFNRATKVKFNKDLLVTQYNMRDTLKELILNQTNLGPKGLIQIKCNALDDDEMIKYLDSAALAGCKMQLIIRGVCTWIPPENTLNKNVTIKSIVWDKLEHSRVYCFGNINPNVYLGSLDLITRKLDNRIETLVRITNKHTLVELCNYMTRYNNFSGAWSMIYDGGNIKYVK